MIAAIQMQWLGVAVAALIVAALLLVVLMRRGRDGKVTAGEPRMAGPAGGSAAPADPASSRPAAPDFTPSSAPQWATPPVSVMSESVATAPVAPPAAAVAPAAPAPAAEAPTAQHEAEALATAPVVEAPATAPVAPPVAPPVAVAPVAVAAPEPPTVTTTSELAPIVTPEQTGSFLDEPLTRGFEGLGKPAATAPAAPMSHGPFPVDPFGSHEDIFPPEEAVAEKTVVGEPAAEEAASAPAVVEEPAAEEAASAPAVVGEPAAHGPVLEALVGEAPMAAAPTAQPETPTLLSDIIVTTGDGEVDLSDPAVRDLLSQLVSDEIELAKACRDQEQTLDAILQLTEAEKICEALRLDDQLAEVRRLLADLQA